MQPRSRGTGRKEARNWYVFHAAPRPIYRGSSRRNFKRGLTYARVCMWAHTYGNVYSPGVVMELCEKQRSLLPLLLSILLRTFGNLRGHKVFRRLILSYSITRARATVFYKGVARDAQRGMGGGHRWKIEFRPWGPVGWSMLTVGKFAFNRARTRHQAPEYPRENLFSFFFVFPFFYRKYWLAITRYAPWLISFEWEAIGLTVRHPAVMTVLAVTQVTFTGCEGLAGAAVHRATDGL